MTADTLLQPDLLQLDPHTRRAWLGGQALELAGRRWELLALLARQPGQVVEQRQLLRALWPGRAVSTNSLRMLVAALRKTLGPGSIVNVAGRGYALALPVAAAPAAPPASATASAPTSALASAPIPAPIPAPPSARIGLTDRLPQPGAALLGRDDALAQLQGLLPASSLTTVLGPGGIGKTALALAAAWRHVQASGQAAVAVDLAALRPGSGAAALCDAVAQACGVQPPPAGDADPGRRLALTLAADAPLHRALLLLDNAEHLVAALQALVLALRRHAPGLRVLVTSQHALNLAGDVLLRLGPLATPGPEAGPADIERSAAVQLLVRRAQAAQPLWRPAEADTAALCELARALDGVPLALEMAAVRLPVWGAHALHQRIVSQRLLLDRDEATHVGLRHPNLRAALAWSFDGLSPEERAALQRLSVLAAPFRPATAGAMLQAAGSGSLVHERLLQRLVDHSMLQWQPPAGPWAVARLRMLEPVRWFAAEGLAAAGAQAQHDARAAHGRALAALAQAACQDLLHSGDDAWRARWLPDHEDFMRAFDAAHARGDAAVAAAVIEVLVQGANVTGHGDPALQRWQATRELAEGAAPIDRARLLGWGNHGGRSEADRRAQSAQRVAAWQAVAGSAGHAGLCAAWAMHAVVCQETGDRSGADAALAACLELEHPAWPVRLRRRCGWLAGDDAPGHCPCGSGGAAPRAGAVAADAGGTGDTRRPPRNHAGADPAGDDAAPGRAAGRRGRLAGPGRPDPGVFGLQRRRRTQPGSGLCGPDGGVQRAGRRPAGPTAVALPGPGLSHRGARTRGGFSCGAGLLHRSGGRTGLRPRHRARDRCRRDRGHLAGGGRTPAADAATGQRCADGTDGLARRCWAARPAGRCGAGAV